MGSLGIVILLPHTNNLAGLSETDEPMRIEALIAKLAVETLDKLKGFSEGVQSEASMAILLSKYREY